MRHRTRKERSSTPMIKIAFWNVGTRAPSADIAAVAAETHADIIALAELRKGDRSLVAHNLCARTGRSYSQIENSFRIPMFTSLPLRDATALRETRHGTFIKVRQIQEEEKSFLLVIVHLPSKAGGDPSSFTHRLRSEIEEEEKKIGHARTIVMGDFNMEPYDRGLVSSEGLHATMCRSIARRRSRIVRGVERRFFYNPMWSLLGDATRGPPGSFYYRKNYPEVIFWQMIDQVIMRPEAIDIVNIDSIRFITFSSEYEIATRDGKPSMSDHFPLIMETIP